jgi:WD40 repeat protein
MSQSFSARLFLTYKTVSCKRVCFSLNDERVIGAGLGSASSWSFPSEKEWSKRTFPTRELEAIALSKDGEWVSGAFSHTNLSNLVDDRLLTTSKVVVWDVETGEEKSQSQSLPGNVTCMEFGITRQYLACCTAITNPLESRVGERHCHLIYPSSGCVVQSDSLRNDKQGQSIAFGSADSMIAITEDSGRIRLGSLDTLLSGGPLGIISLDSDPYSQVALAFDREAKWLAVSGGNGLVRFIDVAKRKIVCEVDRGHGPPNFSLAFSEDGEWVVSGGNKMVTVFSTRTWKRAGTFRAHAGFVNCLAFSHDNKYLASSGEDCAIRIWDVGLR